MTALLLLVAALARPPAVHAAPIQSSPVVVTISPRKGTTRLTCAVDGAAARTCKRRASFRLGPGRHTIAVRARYQHATSAAATVGVLVPQPAPVPVHVGGEPVGIAASGDSVWVSGGKSGDVSRIDASAGTVSGVVHTDGVLGGLAAHAKTVWVSDFGGGRVLRIENGAVTASVEVGGQPTGISVSTGGSVWVGNLNGYLSRIDPATNAVAASVALPSGASMPFFARGLVWIGLQNGSVVSVDAATNQLTGTAIAVAPDVDALADSAAGLWVSTFDGPAALLDPSARTVLRRHKLPGRGSGVTVAAGSAWLSDYDDNLVVRLDAQSGELLGAVRTGRRPRESVAAGNSLWVLDQSDGAVTPIPLPGASPRPAR